MLLCDRSWMHEVYRKFELIMSDLARTRISHVHILVMGQYLRLLGLHQRSLKFLQVHLGLEITCAVLMFAIKVALARGVSVACTFGTGADPKISEARI